MRRIVSLLTAFGAITAFLTILPTAAIAGEDAPDATTSIVAVGGSSVIPDATLAHLNVCVPGATRLAGSNRYTTARAVLSMEPITGGTVYVAQGRTFADALPAGAAANASNSALVLVEPDSVPSPSQAALDAIGPDRFVVVGGTAVISEAVESSLRSRYGNVVRLAGANRYGTAIAVSKFQFPDRADAVILATGKGFIDALAAAPLAAYKNAPLLLLPDDTVPRSIIDEILRLAPNDIYIIGGTAVVSDGIKKQIEGSVPKAVVTRIAGSNRYATAREIARYLPNNPKRLIAVTTTDFPDALAAGSVARTNPLVLIDARGLNGTSASLIANAAGQRCAPMVKLSTFTTYYKAGQSRVTNIHLIADEADNAVVLPGETFSLNEYVGERTEAGGYVRAGAIIGGELYCCDNPANIGGGTSQFATTLYNAEFYAALEDVFHRPHSVYFSRYPLGIEATLSWPSLDVAFRNDTAWPIQIDTSYTSTSVTVDMWGWNDQRRVSAEVTGTATTSAGGQVHVTRTITYKDGTTSSRDWSHTYKGLQKDSDPTPPPPPPDDDPPGPNPM